MTLVRAGDVDVEVLDAGAGEPVLLVQTALDEPGRLGYRSGVPRAVHEQGPLATPTPG